MVGKQVTIGTRHHAKLKRMSNEQGRPMNEIVEEFIEEQNVQGYDGIEQLQ